MKRITRRGWTIGIVLVSLLAVAALVLAVTNYNGMRQGGGWNPTYGTEERWNHVPAIPLSALTITIGTGVAGAVTPYQIGTLPLDAVVIGVIVDIDTAYQTATITVGTAADFDLYLEEADLTETSTGDTADFSHWGANSTADAAVYAFLDNTQNAGTDPGVAHVTILYAIPGTRSSSWRDEQTLTSPTDYTTQTTFETQFPSLDWSDFSGT
jgi:hypothetical protein